MTLITEDRDFGELVIRRRLPVDAVVLLELDRLSNALEAERVSQVFARNQDVMQDNLIVVEPSRIRVRPLPR